MTAHAWPRTAKLDAPRMVERIAEITGVRLILEGPCPGGEVGAAYVRWPDGRRSVLNEGHTRTGPLLDLARHAGIPTARQELSAHIDGRRIVVQQRLPGTPPRTIDAALVRDMVALNTRFAGLLADRPGRTGGRSAPDHRRTRLLPAPAPSRAFAARQPAARLDPRGRRRHPAGHRHRPGAPGLPPGNVLVDHGRVSGVVDFDGATRGDRHLDLVTLRFDLTRRAPHLTGTVDEHLAAHPDCSARTGHT